MIGGANEENKRICYKKQSIFFVYNFIYNNIYTDILDILQK